MNALTSSQRQAKRIGALEEKAKAAGWASWSSFCTAIINGRVQLPKPANQVFQPTTPAVKIVKPRRSGRGG